MKRPPWGPARDRGGRALAGLLVVLLIVLIVAPAWASSGRTGGAVPGNEGLAPVPLEPSHQSLSDPPTGVNPIAPLATVAAPGAAASTYAVTFQETGLVAGTNWSVYLNGEVSSKTTTVAFTEPAGTYYFDIPAVGSEIPSPSEGELNVTDSAVVVTVTFQTGYPVVFVALGLPTGTDWVVSLNGTDLIGGSTNTTVILDAANGSYNYTAFAVGGCWAAPPSGSVTVQGGAAVQFVRFPAVTFQVAFVEVGLPLGTNWSVFFGGKWQSAFADQLIQFSATCGDYYFDVGQVPGYSWVHPGSDYQIHVGGPTGYEVAFSPSTGFLSLAGDTGDYVVALLAGFTAALVAAGVYVRTRPPRPR